MADIMEVLRAIQEFYGLPVSDIESVRLEKQEKAGGFKQRFILKV